MIEHEHEQDQQENLRPQDQRLPRRGHNLRATIVATGAALGMTLAGLGVAAAQSSGPAPESSAQSQRQGQVQPAAEPAPDGPGRSRGFRVGGRPVHGEMTMAKDDGTYAVVATQVGQITAIAADSVTVRSADGYSLTYVMDADTRRRAADGTEKLANGQRVHVLALVKDGTARALHVHDAEQMEERFERRHEHRAEHREQREPRRAARRGSEAPAA